MPHPVFLSYARSASLPYARAVYKALGGAEEDLAFLDESDIEHGERFDARIVEELLGARVVVIFAEPVYFTHWYCLLEYRVARTPFLKSLEPGSSLARETALAPLVLALPPSGTLPDVDRFPPLAQATNWPNVDDPAAVAALVRDRLERSFLPLGDLLERTHAADVKNELLAAVRLPPPLPAGRVPRAPLEIAPSIRDAFVGRADDLWRIDDLLTTRDGGPAATAALAGSIEGGGGLGKTRLALEYLHRFGPKRFPGGLFWIDAEVDSASLEARHHEILKVLDPEALPLSAYCDPQQPRSITRDLLHAVHAISPDAPALFVVDNVPEPGPGEPPRPLSAYCSVVGIAPVLATSRNRISLGALGAVTAIQVDVLSTGAAVALLTRDVRDRAALAPEEWTEIAEWVGRLPLALELLNALLQVGAMSSQDLLAHSRTGEITRALDEGMEALRPTVEPGSLRGATDALSISYDKLSVREQEAVRLLAWLAPEPIPMALLNALGTELFSAAARSVLIHRSFVTRVDSRQVPVYGTLHRVLADFLRTRASDPARELATMTRALTELMDPERCRDPEQWPLMNLLLPHGRSVLTRGMALAGQNESWHLLGLRISILLRGEGLFSVARAVSEEVLEVTRRMLGDEHPNTLTIMNDLGHTLWSQGDLPGARQLQEQVLEVSRRVLGEEHPSTLTAVNNLAVVLGSQGDLPGARQLQEQVLEVSRRVLGEEHPDTLTVMNNLAHSLWSQGDLPGARQLQEQVLEVSRRVLGEEHPSTLTAMNNLAVVLGPQGDLPGARQLQEQVLEVSRRVLGKEHPETLTAMNNLANTLSSQGDLPGARPLQEQVLEGRRRVLGEEHPDTLAVMNNLALTLETQGDLPRARRLLEQVLEGRRRVLGEEHPDTFMVMHDLAVVLRAQGQAIQAEDLETKAGSTR